MGPGALLAPEMMAIVDTDRDRSRELAVKVMARYLRLPNYAGNLLRHGFTDDDVRPEDPSDRLIDAIVVRGTIDDVAARVREHHDAGADHVCIQLLTSSATAFPMAEYRDLAAALDL